jgi:hypothetical protein
MKYCRNCTHHTIAIGEINNSNSNSSSSNNNSIIIIISMKLHQHSPQSFLRSEREVELRHLQLEQQESGFLGPAALKSSQRSTQLPPPIVVNESIVRLQHCSFIYYLIID